MCQGKIFLSVLIVLAFLSTITLAQDFCKGDFNYDGNVDAGDVSVFLQNYGRSIFNNPCPLDGPGSVQKTGQSKCYDWLWPWTEIPCPQPGEPLYGQDGNYQRGITTDPRFTDNGDCTATDNLTGLMWEVKSNYDSIGDFDNPNDADNMYHWQGALELCENLILNNDGEWTIGTPNSSGAKYDDWRLPNLRELQSLVDYSKVNPTIDTDCFPNTWSSSMYWSSTTFVNTLAEAWGIGFYYGYSLESAKSTPSYIRAVRGGR